MLNYSMKKKLQKIALVTGDSSGIGHAACKRLSEENWRVYGASRRKCNTEGWTHLTMDVTDDASVRNAVDDLLQDAQRLDAVVHCAGESFVAPIEEALIEEAQQHFDLNFFGTARVLQAVLPQMRAQRSGKIIVIGSIGGLIGLPFHGYYSAGKFALDGLIEALRPEIKPFGIDAAVLHPGDIKTAIDQRRRITQNTDETSPYHPIFERTVAYYAAAEQNGSPPDLVAREVTRLLNKKHMPVRALAGMAIEKLGVLGKRVMPSRHFEAVMSATYAPKNDKR